MEVAHKDKHETYRSYLSCEEHVEKSTVKDDNQGEHYLFRAYTSTCLEEKKSSISTKKPQTIESLLPDEEDLFSGVIDELGCVEDFDLFSSSGGMELDGSSKLYFHQLNSATSEGLISDQASSELLITSEYPLKANYCFTNSLQSPAEKASIYSQFGHGSYYSTDQTKLHNHGPSFHPPLLPISCESFYNNGVITYDPLNMTGFSGINGGYHVWNCYNSSQNNNLNPVIWSISPNSVICSPHILSHKSPERNTGITSPSSYNRARGRVRRVSHGRHETVSCHTDEKKYDLDIERVLLGEDCRTTLMIKNIPNKYSSAMLLAAINEHNQGTYDFIYLPLDFKNKCNMGYAFINMIDPLQIVHFHKSFNGKKWEKFHSGKVACLAYARIQGKGALIAHFQESSLMTEDKCCHPILFTTDGPNAGSQEPFPLGPSSHSRRLRNRCNTPSL